jgi:serine/threonine protein phosphatase PrpC
MTALMLSAARAATSDGGPNNEDAVFVSPRLAAVADGVGGAAAGEVASRTLIDALVHVDKCRLQGASRTPWPRASRAATRRSASSPGAVPRWRG